MRLLAEILLVETGRQLLRFIAADHSDRGIHLGLDPVVILIVDCGEVTAERVGGGCLRAP